MVNARNYAEKIAIESGLYEDMLEEERLRFGNGEGESVWRGCLGTIYLSIIILGLEDVF